MRFPLNLATFGLGRASVTSGIAGGSVPPIQFTETFPLVTSPLAGSAQDLDWFLESGGRTWRVTATGAGTTTNGGGYIYANHDIETAEMWAEVTISSHNSSNKNAGVLICNDGVDSSIGYNCFVQRTGASSAQLRISKRGVGDVVAFGAITWPGLPYRIGVSRSGTTLTAYIDGVEVASGTDSLSGGVLTGTYAGMYSSDATNRITQWKAGAGGYPDSFSPTLLVIAGASSNLREGLVSQLATERLGPFTKTKILNGTTFEALDVGSNHQGNSIGALNTTFGPEAEIAMLHEANDSADYMLYIVKLGEGKTSMAVDWASGSTNRNNLYTDVGLAKDIVGNSARHLLAWTQGRNDSHDLTDANNFQTNLENFMQDYDTNVGPAHKIIAINTIFPQSESDYIETVRDGQIAVVNADTSTRTAVYFENFEFDPDLIHPDTSGHLAHGNAIYNYSDLSNTETYNDFEEVASTGGLNVTDQAFTLSCEFMIMDNFHDLSHKKIGFMNKWDGNIDEREWMLRWDGGNENLEFTYSLDSILSNTSTLNIPGGFTPDTRIKLELVVPTSGAGEVFIDDVSQGSMSMPATAINDTTLNVVLGSTGRNPDGLLVGDLYTASITIDGETTNLKTE